MKCFCFKHADGSVSFVHLNSNKYSFDGEFGKIPATESPEFVRLTSQGLGYFITETQDKSDIESRVQLYHDGLTDEVKKDLSWEFVLMPDAVIKKKYVEDFNTEIELELAKETPDFGVVNRLNREKEVSKDWTHVECLTKAVEGLDNRIAKGKADKSLIRQKLLAKIG